MVKNKYPHFDPSKHNVDVKIANMKNKTPLDKKILDDLRGGGQLGIRIEDVKSSLSELKKRLKKTVRDAYSCCDCEDHLKWDRLMDSLFKDMDLAFNELIGKGLLEDEASKK